MVNNLPANAGGVSSIPESGRSPGGGNGSPLRYSCLGNPTDRGAWQAAAHGVSKELDTTERLNNDSSPVLGQPLEVHPAISSESLTALGTCHGACVPTAHGTILSPEDSVLAFPLILKATTFQNQRDFAQTPQGIRPLRKVRRKCTGSRLPLLSVLPDA